MKELYLLTPCLVPISDEDFMHLCGLVFNFNNSGYLCCSTPPYRSKFIHQIVAARMGLIVPPGHTIDHIDCDKVNNQRNNLRVATETQQRYNMPLKSDNTTGYRCVRLDPRYKGGHRAEVRINGRKEYFSGTYEACVEFVEKIIRDVHGEFYNPGQ